MIRTVATARIERVVRIARAVLRVVADPIGVVRIVGLVLGGALPVTSQPAARREALATAARVEAKPVLATAMTAAGPTARPAPAARVSVTPTGRARLNEVVGRPIVEDGRSIEVVVPPIEVVVRPSAVVVHRIAEAAPRSAGAIRTAVAQIVRSVGNAHLATTKPANARPRSLKRSPPGTSLRPPAMSSRPWAKRTRTPLPGTSPWRRG